MITVSDAQFTAMVNHAFERLPKTHRHAIVNVAVLTADEPTAVQRRQLRLRGDQTLLGLYEGVPLPARQGRIGDYPPDVITLFKIPLQHASSDMQSLQQNVYHTLWHEVAHYFGLNHADIEARE
jgi:predicted Zn-dependent protease with MMP-like domain